MPSVFCEIEAVLEQKGIGKVKICNCGLSVDSAASRERVVGVEVFVEVIVVLSDGCVRFGGAKVGTVPSCPPGCPEDDGVGVVRPSSG